MATDGAIALHLPVLLRDGASVQAVVDLGAAAKARVGEVGGLVASAHGVGMQGRPVARVTRAVTYHAMADFVGPSLRPRTAATNKRALADFAQGFEPRPAEAEPLLLLPAGGYVSRALAPVDVAQWNREGAASAAEKRPAPAAAEKPEAGDEADDEAEQQQQQPRRKKARKAAPATLVSIAIDAVNVPAEDPAGAAQADARVREAFAAVPVMSAAALGELLGGGGSTADVKAAAAAVAYSFKSGPFRGVLVRRGYDPRADRLARAFQVVTYRLKPAEHEAFATKNITRIMGGPVGKSLSRPACEFLARPVQTALLAHAPRERFDASAHGWFTEAAAGAIKQAVMSRVATSSGGSLSDDAEAVGVQELLRELRARDGDIQAARAFEVLGGSSSESDD